MALSEELIKYMSIYVLIKRVCLCLYWSRLCSVSITIAMEAYTRNLVLYLLWRCIVHGQTKICGKLRRPLRCGIIASERSLHEREFKIRFFMFKNLFAIIGSMLRSKWSPRGASTVQSPCDIRAINRNYTWDFSRPQYLGTYNSHEGILCCHLSHGHTIVTTSRRPLTTTFFGWLLEVVRGRQMFIDDRRPVGDWLSENYIDNLSPTSDNHFFLGGFRRFSVVGKWLSMIADQSAIAWLSEQFGRREVFVAASKTKLVGEIFLNIVWSATVLQSIGDQSLTSLQ